MIMMVISKKFNRKINKYNSFRLRLGRGGGGERVRNDINDELIMMMMMMMMMMMIMMVIVMIMRGVGGEGGRKWMTRYDDDK